MKVIKVTIRTQSNLDFWMHFFQALRSLLTGTTAESDYFKLEVSEEV